MSPYVIPLSGRPERFQVTLLGATYIFRLMYNDVSEGGWTLDIGNAAGEPILAGLPLLPGQNILAMYDHLEIGGMGSALYCKTFDGEAPSASNLADATLIFVEGTNNAAFG